MAVGFVAGQCCFEALVVGAGEHGVGHLGGEWGDVEQGLPAVVVGFAGEHVVLIHQSLQGGVPVDLGLQGLGG